MIFFMLYRPERALLTPGSHRKCQTHLMRLMTFSAIQESSPVVGSSASMRGGSASASERIGIGVNVVWKLVHYSTYLRGKRESTHFTARYALHAAAYPDQGVGALRQVQLEGCKIWTNSGKSSGMIGNKDTIKRKKTIAGFSRCHDFPVSLSSRLFRPSVPC